MLGKVKAKLQASAMTCKLSGAQGQAVPWMTSEQRSRSSMTASIYRQAVTPVMTASVCACKTSPVHQQPTGMEPARISTF